MICTDRGGRLEREGTQLPLNALVVHRDQWLTILKTQRVPPIFDVPGHLASTLLAV